MPDTYYEDIVIGAMAKVVSTKTKYCMCQIVAVEKAPQPYSI